jgi:hypothetical protein
MGYPMVEVRRTLSSDLLHKVHRTKKFVGLLLVGRIL